MKGDISDGTLWTINNEVAEKNYICIYDLPLKYKKRDIQERQEGVSFIEQTVGTDMNELKKYSPAYQVDKINSPYEAIIKKKSCMGSIKIK